jgi:hypothetical protein
MHVRSRRSPERLSVWSRRKFGALDQRTAEAKAERKLVEELSAQVGRPTPAQMIVIRQTARTSIMATLLTRRIIESGDLGDLQARQVLALINTTRLGLVALGLKRKGEAPPDLVQYIGKGSGRAA